MAEANDKKKDAKGEAEAAPAAAAAPAPAKSKKKIFVIAGGVVVLLCLIGVPVFIFAMKPAAQNPNEIPAEAAQKEPQVPMEGSHDEDQLAEGEEALGAFFPFENFVVNLSGAHYVRAQVQLEFNEKDIPKRFYTRLVPIRDAIISTIAKRSPEDLLAEKGKDTLKNDIKEMINEALKKEDVKQVYFTQFFIQ